MFFGAAATFRDTMSHIARTPQFLVLRMRGMPAIDSSGLRALRQFLQRSKHDGVRVLLTELQAQPREVLERAGVPAELGEDSLFSDFADAVAYARDRVDGGAPTPP